MTFANRTILAATAAALAFGIISVPAAEAADSMMKSSAHKGMKKHGKMKGDAMKGDAMKSDDKGDAPAQ